MNNDTMKLVFAAGLGFLAYETFLKDGTGNGSGSGGSGTPTPYPAPPSPPPPSPTQATPGWLTWVILILDTFGNVADLWAEGGPFYNPNSNQTPEEQQDEFIFLYGDLIDFSDIG